MLKYDIRTCNVSTLEAVADYSSFCLELRERFDSLSIVNL